MGCQTFINSLRINREKELLWFTQKTVTEIAYEAGFGSSQYFCRVFMQYTQTTPLEYRNLWKHQVAEEIGADYYTPDGGTATETAKAAVTSQSYMTKMY